MKKILLYTAIVLLSVTSCLKFEEPKSLEVVNAGAPAVEVSGVTENTFTATITPAAGTNFYAYAVLEGEVNPKVSASNLLKVKVGSGIAEGLVDVKNEATKTLNLKGLVGNTKYTVYAAATNEQGQIAEVTAVEVLTDDKTAPSIKAVSVAKTGQVQFTEPVKLVSGKKAWVTYYKYYAPEDSVTMEVPAKNMSVKGSVLTLTPPKHIPGAYTIYTYEKGLVTDLVGQECPAQTRQMFAVETDIYASDSLVVKGVGGRIPTEKFEIKWLQDNKAKDTLLYVEVGEFDLKYEMPETIVKNKLGSKVAVYRSHMFNGSENLSYTALDGYTLDSDTTMTLNFYASSYNEYTLVIEEGALTDVYGNVNAEYSRENFIQRLLCVSTGVTGTYWFYGGTNTIFQVQQVDDTTAYVYELDNRIANTHPLKAKYDKKKGTITIPFGQTYYKAGNYNIGFYGWNITRLYPDYEGDIITEGEVTLEILDNGWLASEDMYILAQLPESEDEDAEFRFEDVDVYNLGLLYDCYAIVKRSNNAPAFGTTSTINPENYVETPKAIGTLADMPRLMAERAK